MLCNMPPKGLYILDSFPMIWVPPYGFKIPSNQHFTYCRENWISAKGKSETKDKENVEWSRAILNALTEKTKVKNTHSLICFENIAWNSSSNEGWDKGVESFLPISRASPQSDGWLGFSLVSNSHLILTKTSHTLGPNWILNLNSCTRAWWGPLREYF